MGEKIVEINAKELGYGSIVDDTGDYVGLLDLAKEKLRELQDAPENKIWNSYLDTYKAKINIAGTIYLVSKDSAEFLRYEEPNLPYEADYIPQIEGEYFMPETLISVAQFSRVLSPFFKMFLQMGKFEGNVKTIR